MRRRLRYAWLLFPLIGLSLFGCGRKCEGPKIDSTSLERIKRSLFDEGPSGFLLLPNPIDGLKKPTAAVDDTETLDALRRYSLPGLLDARRLENKFIKVRIKDIRDSASDLATPNTKGEFAYRLNDVHYSEVMAYHSAYTVMRYVETLGFSVVKSRPLYILVRYPGKTANEVNAVYDHNYLNPSMPRTMRLTGGGAFSPGVDRDMYWHEFGHLFNESASNEVGMDLAGDAGAIYSEGSAMHECLADYLAESMSNRAYIGRWLARNLKGFGAGDPLRSAVDAKGSSINYEDVSLNDGTGANPERYRVAEWCTRVLWQIRERMVKDFGSDGAVLSDRLVFSAVSLLKRDSGFEVFRDALVEADEKLHCGSHTGEIRNAFESRGFGSKSLQLDRKLTFQAEAVSLDVSGSSFKESKGGRGFGFKIRIANPNRQVARNVRVRLESNDPNVTLVTYQQGYGDIPGGGELNIGTDKMAYEFSVAAEVDANVPAGKIVEYTIRLFSDNGPESVLQGQVRL